MDFVVGDLVMLLMHGLFMCNNYKFAVHLIKPSKVLKYVDKLAYCIELPPIYSELHKILHVSKLKSNVLVVVMGLVPKYSRFWLMMKNSMRLRKLWQNVVAVISSSTWFIGLVTRPSMIYGCLNLS